MANLHAISIVNKVNRVLHIYKIPNPQHIASYHCEVYKMIYKNSTRWYVVPGTKVCYRFDCTELYSVQALCINTL